LDLDRDGDVGVAGSTPGAASTPWGVQLRKNAKSGAAAVHEAGAKAVNAVERATGLDLDRDGDVGVAGEQVSGNR
jgi:hypothetical protein